MTQATPQLTVHFKAADGATFDLVIPGPVVVAVPKAQVRIASFLGYGVKSSYSWNGSAWVKAS